MIRRAMAWAFIAWLPWLIAAPAFANDTVYYYLSDTLHSEVVVTDQNRNLVEQTGYAPYGQVLNRALRDGPGYTGHEEDPETGLVYMQQRYYDAQSGLFLSTDPVAASDDGGNFNRYWYASDNPYVYTDPDGEADQPIAAPGPCNAGSACPRGGDQAVPQADNKQEVTEAEGKPKITTLEALNVVATAIARAVPEMPPIPWGAIGTYLGAAARVSPYTLFVLPTTMGSAPCELPGAAPCGMMSELGEKAPTDAPPGTLPLDKAKEKFGLSKDDIHKIKDNATGGMGGGKTWVGVDPNREVGTSENGKWIPQGTIDELKH